MSETVLTDKNFESEVLNGKGVYMIEFWAPWCGPCRMLDPIVEELAKDFEGKAKIGKLNVDESPDMAGKHGVMSIPTVMIFKDGSAAETFIGVQPQEVLAEKIQNLLK